MNTLMSSSAAADDHIQITSEILLESGTPVEARAITQTHEGGYIVAGTNGRAWATRVDAVGSIQ
jgi:hypothetical protein